MAGMGGQYGRNKHLIREFSSERLDDDYFELSVRLIEKLGRKRTEPFMSGKIEI